MPAASTTWASRIRSARAARATPTPTLSLAAPWRTLSLASSSEVDAHTPPAATSPTSQALLL
eukprot:scaffold80198_cov73-Phaeocystis_antarctica.AAC.8